MHTTQRHAIGERWLCLSITRAPCTFVLLLSTCDLVLLYFLPACTFVLSTCELKDVGLRTLGEGAQVVAALEERNEPPAAQLKCQRPATAEPRPLRIREQRSGVGACSMAVLYGRARKVPPRVLTQALAGARRT